MSAKAEPGTIAVGVAAKLIMVSERRVQQLAAQGWIKKPYTIVSVVQGYIRFLQDEERKASRTAGEEEIRRERARKLKLGNDETERLSVRTDDAVAAIDAVVGLIKAELAGVAVRVAADVALRRKIEDGIDQVLAGLAGRCEKACADLCAGRDALAAGAADDAEPVGAAQ